MLADLGDRCRWKGLNRVSRDPQYHEVGAIELPDGDLLFVSTRRGGYTLCQPGPCSNLHVMRRDVSDVRCVSQNTLADFSPRLLPDGRVLFTRWEYIDRDLTYRQSLWTQNPDGRHFQLFFGNTIRDVGTFWQARPVPGKDNLLVATFAPHHGWPHGAIGLIDNRAGVESPRGQGFAWMTHEFQQIGDRSYRWSYRDPFPVNDYQFLVAYGGGGDGAGRFALYVLDLCGNRVPVYSDPEQGCYGPLLLRPERAALQVSSLENGIAAPNDSVQWGTVMVADVPWINLSQPENSAALTAHLDQHAGGRGCGTEEGGHGEPLFEDTSDPDYVAMLAAIREGRKSMLARPRADMPGFKSKDNSHIQELGVYP